MIAALADAADALSPATLLPGAIGHATIGHFPRALAVDRTDTLSLGSFNEVGIPPALQDVINVRRASLSLNGGGDSAGGTASTAQSVDGAALLVQLQADNQALRSVLQAQSSSLTQLRTLLDLHDKQ